MLIIDIIIAFIYGILYVFLTEIVYSMNDAPYFDPHFWRLFGGAILTIGIVAIYAFIKKEWNDIKSFVFYVLVFLIVIGIINITSAIYVTRSMTNLGFHWLDTILIILLAILNGFFYMRENKK
jgi:DMSO reductase anchor subunit